MNNNSRRIGIQARNPRVESPITTARLNAGLSRRELAKAVGAHANTIERIENRRTPLATMGAQTYLAICRALNLDPRETLAFENHLYKGEHDV